MSIDMILGMAESQTQGIKNLVTKQNEAYTELQKSLAEFILQTDKLKGVTYDSAKKYCAVVIEPLVRGCILLNEEISRANEKYISTYKSEVDTVSLKQQELERLIREAESQIRRVEHLLNLLYQEDPISYSQISMAEENKETYRKLKNELEEKLRKLLAFNAKSPSIFSEVEVLKSSVDQGLAQAEKSWSPTSKTFNLPSRSDMGWASVIESIDAKYTAEKERLKSENNNKLTDQEYDRVISQITGINGKPLFGASVIKNASPEEKKDLLLATLPWIMPGGTLRLTMLSGGALGLLDGVISEDKPSDIIRKMAIGSTFGFIGHLGFNLLSKGTKVKDFLKVGRNSEDKVLKQKKVNSQKVYGEKEFLEEMDKYPRVKIDEETRQMLINMPKEKRLDPKQYLSPKEIEEHLKIFEEEGVAKIISWEQLENAKNRYGGSIGPESGQYATSEEIIEKAIKASDGNPRKLEKLLGLGKGELGENPVVIKPKKVSFLKFPSGNEKGANAYWNPGGYTSGGIPEVVVNQFAPGEYTFKEAFKGVIK